MCNTLGLNRTYESIAVTGRPATLHEWCGPVREVVDEVWEDTVDST